MRISSLRKGDVPGFVALFKRVVTAVPYYSRGAKKAELAKYTARNIAEKMRKGYVFLAAKQNNKIVGFCFAHYDDGPYWLDWYGVDPRHRREGIATRLLTALEQRLRKKTHKIWCDSRANNRESIALFRKNGFRRIARIRNHWYNQDFLLWEKSL